MSKKDLAKLEQENQGKILENYQRATGHAAPSSRREFLASGLMSFAGYLAAPSLLQVIASEASAAELSAECIALMEPSGPAMIPFIHVNLSGGASLMQQVLMLDAGRQPLASYSRCGLGKTSNFTTETEFGNIQVASQGGVLIAKLIEGLRATAGASTQKTAMVTMAIRSQDDSANNPFSIMGLVNSIGVKGTYLPNLAFSGATNRGAFVQANPPQTVGSIDSVLGALAPGGTLRTMLATPTQRDGLLKLVRNLSSSQKRNLASTSSGQMLGKLVDCAASKNIDLANVNTTELDPRANAAVSAVWGIDMTTAANATSLRQAAIVYNALKGNAGAARIDMGGYDYHGNTRAVTDGRDLAAGQLLGNILVTAEAMGKPVFIHLTSDGAVETPASDAPGAAFSSDSGTRGTGHIFVYNPAGRPATSDSQIGHFNTSQSADGSFITNWTVERSSLAVFANYLKLNNKLGLLDSLAPRQFDTNDLGKILKFA